MKDAASRRRDKSLPQPAQPARRDDLLSGYGRPGLDSTIPRLASETKVDGTPAVSLRKLTKRYDDGTLALESLDLEVPAGGFFGLLGPTGPARRR